MIDQLGTWGGFSFRLFDLHFIIQLEDLPSNGQWDGNDKISQSRFHQNENRNWLNPNFIGSLLLSTKWTSWIICFAPFTSVSPPLIFNSIVFQVWKDLNCMKHYMHIILLNLRFEISNSRKSMNHNNENLRWSCLNTEKQSVKTQILSFSPKLIYFCNATAVLATGDWLCCSQPAFALKASLSLQNRYSLLSCKEILDILFTKLLTHFRRY